MKDYIEYFTGLKRDYGFCNIKNGKVDPESGKIRIRPGDYGWAGKPITDKDYEEHLKGEKSIGIQPCDDDGMARFGAIDIDPKIYNKLDIKFYLDVIQSKELPLIPVKSKSGGLHLYVFTKEPIKALLIKEFLEQLLFLFKLPLKTEIFPKQTKLGKNTDGEKINGNFINLPYFNKSERVALNPNTGEQISFDLFLNCLVLNARTAEELKKIQEDIITTELTGGIDEFKDGPPCLAILTKNGKMNDGRDRFLYNYMVFAKKKYPDDWQKKVKLAARNYFEFDDQWQDTHVEKKIKTWDKKTAGHTCNEDPINTVCLKAECVKRKYGIASERISNWPTLSNLQKIDFKPDPEYYFTVEKKDGETVPVHAKDIAKIRDQREMRGLIMAQADIVPPPKKSNEYFEMIDGLFNSIDVVQPAPGTRPLEKLKKHLEKFINGPQANSHITFKNGNVLKDKQNAYFVFDEFYSDLRDNEWKKDESRTSYMIEKLYEKEKEKGLPGPEFGKKKRYPGKDKEGKPFPGVNGCAMIPLHIFEDEEDEVEEIAKFKIPEEIV